MFVFADPIFKAAGRDDYEGLNAPAALAVSFVCKLEDSLRNLKRIDQESRLAIADQIDISASSAEGDASLALKALARIIRN